MASTRRRPRPIKASIISGSRSAALTPSPPISRPRELNSPKSRPRSAPACASASSAGLGVSIELLDRSVCELSGDPSRGTRVWRTSAMRSPEPTRSGVGLLTPEQYDVMREHGTEAPGSCALNFEKRHGTFDCAGCGQPLFVSKKSSRAAQAGKLQRPGRGFGRNVGRSKLRDGPHRGALQPLRKPSGSRLRRWPAADEPALLHQRYSHELPARMTMCGSRHK